MKITIKRLGIAAFTAMLIFALIACEETKMSPVPTPPRTVINIAAIKGVIVPAYGLTPITAITENEQYRGTVTWNDNPSTFGALTSYTAIITLTAKDGFTLKGVAANFFTVVGATSVSNAADSGVITAIFPPTDSKLVNSIVIKTQPDKLIYTYVDALDLAGLVVTLTYDDGTRVEVIAENLPIKSITTDPAQGDMLKYYEHNGQPIKIKYGNMTCNSDNLSILTPTFTSIADLETYLQSIPANTADNPYIVALNVDDISTLKTTLDRASKYIYLDLSGSTINYIPNAAFYTDTDTETPTLTGITIPDSVTSIGNYAFSGCTGLTSITVTSSNTVYRSEGNCVIQISDNKLILGIRTSIIPDSVTSIGDSAFSGCSGLTSVTIPDSVTSIGSYAFSGCSGLTSVTIPDSVVSIGSNAFQYCSGLTSVTIGNGVTSIGYYAFQYCSGLTSVTIGNGVTSIGSYAFYYCSGLASITVASGNTVYRSEGNCVIRISGNNLILGIRTSIIPDSVVSIDNTAFYHCSGLTSVTIPDSVVSIGRYAFSYCSGLTSVTIGNGVTSIGYEAFYGCGLTSVTIPDSVTSIGDKAFCGCSGLTSVTIGNGVTSIGLQAFLDCSGLTNVTIPDSVTSIGNYAFSGCTGLTSITVASGNTVYRSEGNCLIRISDNNLILGIRTSIIPDSVTSIGEGAFFYCSGLTNVTIPDSVTSIGYEAFCGCSGLTSVTIPDSVTSIGYQAFSGCSGLTSVTFQGTITSANFNTNAFNTDLRDKYLAGGIGTYTKQTVSVYSSTWTKI
ncbi:leucine-rich repeat domain-containing protein [Treponema sp. R80B11-R83G3]